MSVTAGESAQNGNARSKKRATRWDKAGVIFQGITAIAVPISLIALIVGVYQFKSQQKSTADQVLNQQRQATLDNYLNEISALVLNYKLASAQSKLAVRALAVARTDTALRNLDGTRKGILIRYLWEAGLIRGRSPVVDLHKVNLGGTVLKNAYLYGVNLGTDDLVKADFYGADTHGANLSWADLSGADLSKANLGCSTVSQFDVSVGLLTQEHPSSIDCTDLKRAVLTGANLQEANLTGANLSWASLAGADLHGARYNVKQIVVGHTNGDAITVPKTQWPTGFSPSAAGAICIDCS